MQPNWMSYDLHFHRFPMMIMSVLLSLLALTLLGGCASEPKIITKTEVVEVDREVPLRVPRSRLINCPAVPLPPPNLEWKDLAEQWEALLQVIERCDGQIDAFWMWHDGQFVN